MLLVDDVDEIWLVVEVDEREGSEPWDELVLDDVLDDRVDVVVVPT